MILALRVAVAIAAAYQLASLIAVIRHLFRVRHAALPPTEGLIPVSILKPIRGLDPEFYQCIRSHAVLDYPKYEILFGVSDSADPAVALVERLRQEFPHRNIRLLVSHRTAANGKVGVLTELADHARHPLLVVNDSDVVVPPGYLCHLAAAFEDPAIGLVTCLYRAGARRFPGAWEALGIAVDFMPSTLVAPMAGVKEFGLGSTLAFRAGDLERIGGFAAIADYLADDYQLARRITQLGLRVKLSEVIVETNLGDDTWAGVWKHQLRWARTIRFSRAGGYAGLPVTHAGVWALIAAACGAWWLAAPLLVLRIAAAFTAGWLLLGSRAALRYFWLAPLWDLWAFCVWIAGYCGDTVQWRDRRLRISRDGRIARR